MKVYFIGAGPGDPKLITVRGAEIIASCPIVIYTGSLVPKEVLAYASPDALIIDSAGLDLDGIMKEIEKARDLGHDVARVHTGDPSIYGAIAEQIRRLDEMGVEYEITPGVSSFLAAAAALGVELTAPELSQTIVITRMEGRTPMPEKEKLADFAKTGATLVLFLSVTMIEKVMDELAPHYGKDCPVAVVHRASWPDQKIIKGFLGDIVEKVKAEKIKSQSIIIVGRVLSGEGFAESRLYDASFSHQFRKASKEG